MSSIKVPYGAPLWIASTQIAAVAQRLKQGNIQEIQNKLAAQTLSEQGHHRQTHDRRLVTLWAKANESPMLAIALHPNGQLTLATKGAIMLPFNDGSASGLNAALLTTDQNDFQLFGKKPQERLPGNPSFKLPQADLAHFAFHMIGKPHNCNGSTDAPAPGLAAQMVAQANRGPKGMD